MSDKKRARESRAAIERLYITMRHLFIRGSYKPMGVSGRSLRNALLELSPEIYGTINDREKVELNGLLYVMERLPQGIEECQFIKLVAREGFSEVGHPTIIPPKRRRNCFRIDNDRMYIEMTRGRSDIYDILTHLTFLYIEAEKIKNHALDPKEKKLTDDWMRLEEIVQLERQNKPFDEKKAVVYLSNVLGRTIHETQSALRKFRKSKDQNSLYHIAYWLGKTAIEEWKEERDKEISFTAKLREVVGHHIYGERWDNRITTFLMHKGWEKRPIHIISANLHSFMNAIYGFDALPDQHFSTLEELAIHVSREENISAREAIKEHALANGMYEVLDHSGTNLAVQVFDLAKVNFDKLPDELQGTYTKEEMPLLLVMDYAFGEQAFECMDELLKPNEVGAKQIALNVESISIMGKAGILEGGKGDIMVPTAHVFEGTADNYPIQNDFKKKDFKGFGLNVFEGPMVTVLGTSLQNRDVLYHFKTSTWNAIGLEMEGAHYQKAIQSATMIRKSIKGSIKLRYAYYASDNPLETGSTLASGSLGMEGIKPTYLITSKILSKILKP
ncbi:MAG: DUF6909 family protein [Flammeovirgaceae bacterium]